MTGSGMSGGECRVTFLHVEAPSVGVPMLEPSAVSNAMTEAAAASRSDPRPMISRATPSLPVEALTSQFIRSPGPVMTAAFTESPTSISRRRFMFGPSCTWRPPVCR